MKTILILLLISLITCCPFRSDAQTNEQPNLIKYWDLPTGSHIAYIHIPASDTINSIPLIFLHGGPGACQVNSFGKEAPEDWYRKLSRNCFDIYLYDQVGSGFSGRLSDPLQYSVDRHIADLECIRVIAGNKPCVLIGDSWGATLAVHYMARYPENVIKAIFTSPGSIDFRDWNNEYWPRPRFPQGWFNWIENRYDENGLMRYTKLDTLLQSDVHVAYEFAGDTEMDKLADEFITAEVFQYCVYNKAFTKSKEFRMEGMGWWASTMTVWNLMHILAIKDSLRQIKIPVLILRGDADYLQPGIAQDYSTFFSNSVFKKIPKAGHFIWLDQPEIYRNEIQNFLIKE